MAVDLRPLTQDDLPRLGQSWKKNWGDEFVVAHGVIYRPDALEGFIAVHGEERAGEIVCLDSLRQRQGVGTLLIEKVVEAARPKGCRRIFVITTNDNLRALGFYQKRGFELAAIHRGAVHESRKTKPMTGNDGIPLRDEIELEMPLRGET